MYGHIITKFNFLSYENEFPVGQQETRATERKVKEKGRNVERGIEILAGLNP